MGLSTARQVEIQRDTVLKAWFEQREKDKGSATQVMLQSS
jgi:hypothetical protein